MFRDYDTIEKAHARMTEYFNRPGAVISRVGQLEIRIDCRYRDPQGNACAVGCLIDDSEYRPRFEGLNISDVLDEYGTFLLGDRSGISPDLIYFLRKAQAAHDRANTVEDFRDWLDAYDLPEVHA